MTSKSVAVLTESAAIFRSKKQAKLSSWLLDVMLWTSWSKIEQKQFHSQCKELLLLEDISTRETLINQKILVRAVFELLNAGMKEFISRETCVEELKLLLSINPARFASVMSDVWSTMDCVSYCKGNDGLAKRDMFVDLTQDTALPFYFLFEEKFDTDLLPEIGILTGPEIKVFNQKLIRLKTKSYYKQQKFNLFREEPEGYGKLIAELGRSIERGRTDEMMLDIIQRLIGTHYLDPNRVLDIVLEAFECQPNADFFGPLIIRLSASEDTLCEILAFKLENAESSRSLYILIAHLLRYGVIDLDCIYPWLKPENRVIEKSWERQINDATEYASQSMKVKLGGNEANANPFFDEEEFLVEDRRTYSDNNKLLLCKALLDVGAWNIASDLLERHPRFSLTSCSIVARSLVRLYTYLIDPLYRKCSNLIGRRKIRLHSAHGPAGSTQQIHDFDEFENSFEILLALGPYIHCDPVLMYKVLRIFKFYLDGVSGKAKTEIYWTFVDVLDDVILPALCFTDGNSALTREVWSVLGHYPYAVRFRLYGSWKSEQTARLHPALVRRRVDILKQVKQQMRRISKENVKFMGRQLGKLSHSIPGIVFDYVLSQVQLFDNLIAPVIDALKYLSPLGYDILGYCFLEALSPVDPQNLKNSQLTVMLTADRPRTKHDGSTIAPWIQSLAVFTGTICKKYSLDLTPILQYVTNQLKAMESLDLLILKEIVQKMTGIEAAEDITSEQLEAMSGGELLRSEAGYFGQLRTSKKSASRLREATSSNDLAITLCILMAQQRNRIIYDETQGELHTKLVGKLYDQCQDTLVQFGTFLATSCTLDEYAKKIPPVSTLLEEYHMDCDVAFFLWRPIFAYLVTSKYDELRRGTKGHKKMSATQLQQIYATASSSILDPVVDVIRNHLPIKTWEDISPQFFVTFWSLTLYDLWVPREAYARETNRIKQMSIAAAENKEFTSSKRRKEQERCAQLIEKLQEEERRQEDHVSRVLAKLATEKDTWFTPRAQKSAKNEAVTAFLQLCIFPRCVYTAPDALYCAQFVTTIHLLSTPNFSTLICYDRVFCDIIYTVTSCTENEANRYGRFLNALLFTVMKWHGDKLVFQKECASFPGFVTKFRATNTAAADANDHVDYENFRHVCHKWHYKITKCVIVCLESKDFTQIRNALLVLQRILPSYPRVKNLAHAVERWVERVCGDQKDKRPDLHALATSYIGQLKAKIPNLIPEDLFHNKSSPDKSGTGGAAAELKLPKTPTRTEDKKSEVKVADNQKNDKPTQAAPESPPPTPTQVPKEEKVTPPKPIVKEEVKTPPKSPPKVPKAESKTAKSEPRKTVKIKISEVQNVTTTETNGSDKGKVSRKADTVKKEKDSKDKEVKRRKIDDTVVSGGREARPASSPSANSNKRHISKK